MQVKTGQFCYGTGLVSNMNILIQELFDDYYFVNKLNLDIIKTN